MVRTTTLGVFKTNLRRVIGNFPFHTSEVYNKKWFPLMWKKTIRSTLPLLVESDSTHFRSEDSGVGSGTK